MILKERFILLLTFFLVNSSIVYAACSNPQWVAAGWSVGDIVSQNGKDYRLVSAGWGPFDPEGAGAGNWVLENNPCATAAVLPNVTTTDAATSITATSAFCGGTIAAPAADNPITERGVVFKTAAGPTVTDNDIKAVEGGTTVSAFTLTVSGLTGGTKYFMRAFATTVDGTSYGPETWFYTGVVPSVTTVAAIDIHCESFTSGGSGITFGRDKRSCCGVDALGDLLASATEFGVIYGTVLADVTNSTPASLVGASIKDVHIANNASSLNQTPRNQEMTGLTPATSYYHKAYATNTQGTGYGNVETFSTTAACPVLYSCPWDAAVANRWSFNTDCSTADGASLTSNTICYHRHDWLSAPIADLDADVATQSGIRAMTELPYRLVMQSGSRVVVNNPVFVGGFQLEIQSNAQYSNNGSLTFNVDNTAGAQGHIARLSNAGSVLVRGSYANNVALSGVGEYCKTGNFVNTLTSPGSLNGDYAVNPAFPDTKYSTGSCVGTSTLPVELLSFEAKKSNSDVFLEWVTGSELNNDYFLVQKSLDGKIWENISTVMGQGTTFDVTNYGTVDYEVFNQLVYYRLVQVDIDGAKNYSKTRVVNGGDLDNKMYVFVNKEYLYLNLPLETNLIDFKLLNVNGQLMDFDYNVQNNSLVVPLKSNFHPGIYFIQVNTSEGHFYEKFILK